MDKHTGWGGLRDPAAVQPLGPQLLLILDCQEE
jgi:hypothetical protein